MDVFRVAAQSTGRAPEGGAVMPDARLERTRRNYWIVNVVTHNVPNREFAGAYDDEQSARQKADAWRVQYPKGNVTLFPPMNT